jgi:hypothetical protein
LTGSFKTTKSPIEATDDSFRIHALICTYNDHVALPFALDSVRDTVDSIIVADGAYSKYYRHYRKFTKEAKPYSTDGTLEMLHILQRDLPPIKLIECPNGKPWTNQVVKRTVLLDAVPPKDWFLILDSDEMFWGDIKGGVHEIMSSGCIAGCMPLFNVGVDMSGLIPFWHPRVFLKLPGMHYERKHWFLCDFAHRVIEETYPLWHTDRFVMAHLKVLREHRRLAPHMSYMLDMEKSGFQEPYSPTLEKMENEVITRK